MFHLIPIIVIVVLFGVFAYVGARLRELGRLHREHLEVLATGKPATGRIRKLEATGRAEGTRTFPILELRLDVEVSVPGQPPYTVQTRQLVDQHRVASVQPGQHVHLRVDRNDPQRIALTDTPGDDAQGALYRDAPTDAPPAAPSAEPLFSPQRARTSRMLLTIAMAMAVLGALVPYLRFGVNWAALSPPEGGFCAAAVRCCNVVPREPVDEVLVKLMSDGPFKLDADPCARPLELDERGCQRMYEHYQKEAEASGLRCE